MKIGVTVDQRVLEQSGSIILASGSSSFALTIEDLSFRFLFESDAGEARWTTEGVNPKSATFHLYNWDNSLGVAHSFDNIATINAKQIHLSLYVQTIGTGAEALRLINYSVFVG